MRTHRSPCTFGSGNLGQKAGECRNRLVVLAGAHRRVAQFALQIEILAELLLGFDLDDLHGFLGLVIDQEETARFAQQKAAQIAGLRRVSPVEQFGGIFGLLHVQIEHTQFESSVSS